MNIFDSLLKHLGACTWPEVVNVADKTKVPYATIAKIKRGITPNPRIGTVIRLMDYFEPKQFIKKAKAA